MAKRNPIKTNLFQLFYYGWLKKALPNKLGQTRPKVPIINFRNSKVRNFGYKSEQPITIQYIIYEQSNREGIPCLRLVLSLVKKFAQFRPFAHSKITFHVCPFFCSLVFSFMVIVVTHWSSTFSYSVIYL